MMPNKRMLMMMTCLMVGCQSAPSKSFPASTPSALIDARRSFAVGDLSVANKKIDLFLSENPSSDEGQHLKAQILDAKIVRGMEVLTPSDEAEFSEDRKKAEIKTLLERSRSLLELGEFDEAAAMVESVFDYDAQNRQASQLLDQIKEHAWTAGKKEIQDGRAMAKAEVDDRAGIYRQQAQDYMDEGQWGAAQMGIQKLLLLYPEDKEGLKMLDQIKSKQRRSEILSAQS